MRGVFTRDDTEGLHHTLRLVSVGRLHGENKVRQRELTDSVDVTISGDVLVGALGNEIVGVLPHVVVLDVRGVL